MRHLLIALALVVGMAGSVSAVEPSPVWAIKASTANPAASDAVRVGPASGVVCAVTADANAHAVTVYHRLRFPDGTTTGWVEWTTAAGVVPAASPNAYSFVIPYWLDEIKISVANAGGDTINAVCTPLVNR